MFVVCHMLASLDGKIDGAFFGAPETAPALHAYGELRGFYHCQATLYGTTTMLGGYADGLAPALPSQGTFPAQEDWVNPEGREVGNFIVSVDPKGELGFSSHLLERKGRPAAHVIEALDPPGFPGIPFLSPGAGHFLSVCWGRPPGLRPAAAKAGGPFWY